MKIRNAKFAGSWYTDNQKRLKSEIEGMLSEAEHKSFQHIYGLIVPHAAYQFSGKTAACAYNQLANRHIQQVFIFSPEHRGDSDHFTATKAEIYRSPLGDVSVDQELLTEFERQGILERVEEDEEHAIEIQLPFLQAVLETFILIPIMVPYVNQDRIADMIDAAGRKASADTLFIASSDLYHEFAYRDVVYKDRILIEALKKYDINSVKTIFSERGCTVCGKVPIQLVLELASKSGGKKVAILNHTTSGDVTGNIADGEYTVGYLSAAII